VGTTRLHIGIGVDQNLPWATLVERWRLIEALGFDSIWDFDHLNQPSRPDGPYLEAWSVLAGLAVHTRRVRIGVLVSCNTFRHPSVLAKQAITLDHMSGGRLDVGLGAGCDLAPALYCRPRVPVARACLDTLPAPDLDSRLSRGAPRIDARASGREPARVLARRRNRANAWRRGAVREDPRHG
jgi:alkanesulfonate monooxygenase SsuD/methylene tetrahydromethanopterin reductase-like flavin-dependent oxidoreductase (luciferase family)